MRAHIIDAQGVILNTAEVASLDAIPGLIDAAIGGTIGDSIVNGAVVQQAGPDIDIRRAELIKRIDADVDKVYDDCIGSRTTEYLMAETEAAAYKLDGYAGDVPASVQAWATAKSATAQWAADDVLSAAAGWRAAQAALRAHRLARKESARVAVDNAALDAIEAQRSGFIAAIRAQLGI